MAKKKKSKKEDYTNRGTPSSPYLPDKEGRHPTRGWKVCAAKKRTDGKPCMHQRGHGTDHLGIGRCKYHGGNAPIKHGLYSATLKEKTIKQLIEGMKDRKDDPLDLVEDLYLIRALAIDFVNRYEEFADALIRWNQSWQSSKDPEKVPKPVRVYDISHASKLIRDASALVKQILDQRDTGSITMKTFNILMERMAMVVASHIPDADTLRLIERDWNRIQIDDWSGGSGASKGAKADLSTQLEKDSRGQTIH